MNRVLARVIVVFLENGRTAGIHGTSLNGASVRGAWPPGSPRNLCGASLRGASVEAPRSQPPRSIHGVSAEERRQQRNKRRNTWQQTIRVLQALRLLRVQLRVLQPPPSQVAGKARPKA